MLVLNGEREILREGDAVELDLDGNGLVDDLTFFQFGTDDARLTDDGLLYVVSTVRLAGSSQTRGQVFAVIDTNEGIGTQFCMTNPNSTGVTSSIVALGSATPPGRAHLLEGADGRRKGVWLGLSPPRGLK